MNNNFVMVRSASDWTLVVDVPHLNLHRVWTKRGQKYPIERDALIQAYYRPAVEALFRDGALIADDKDFLREVGLLDEKDEPVIYELTDTMKQRIIKLMPVAEVKKEIAKMSQSQINEVVDYAIDSHVDLIVSHHPLIFRPIASINEENHIGRKIIKLLENGISVFSFHTRLDKVEGGVNDRLCQLLGIRNAVPFGEGDLGRVGDIEYERMLDDFAYFVKETLDADTIRISDAFNPVRRVAVVGGDGKSYVADAIRQGADTYISGRIGYNVMEEAAEMGINLIEAGHYFTEQPICAVLQEMLLSFDPTLTIEVISSNLIKPI